MFSSESNPYQSPYYDGSPTARSAIHTKYVLSGCLTVADVLAANRLATRGFWLRITIAVMIAYTFSVVLIAFAFSIRSDSPQAANIVLLTAVVIVPALFVAPIAIGRLRLHRFARNRFGMFAPTHSTFTSSKMVIASENAQSELQWELFSHCIANETVAILFYKNANQYLILARQKLDVTARWEAFISMIKSRFPS